MLVIESQSQGAAPLVWQVGALCRAVADALAARFNPVALRGEISGFSRASSGHCYFSVKDDEGQLRCAMFRRAASLLDFSPRDGEAVELRGRLSIYEARGDLQLIVESMSRVGAGALFEQFLLLKSRLEAEGLFDPARKRPLAPLPRTIGVVTSPGAAALRDVLTALARRAPQVRVVLAPARVQGAGAAAELCAALSHLYHHRTAALVHSADLAHEPGDSDRTTLSELDLILLVRGGGSIEDLWAFNDERLARTIRESPVPVIVGVGHETDFTIADFIADLRAPTPTAAAEMATAPREFWFEQLDRVNHRLRDAIRRRIDREAQRVDRAALALGRPSQLAHGQRLLLARQRERLGSAVAGATEREQRRLQALQERMQGAARGALQRAREQAERAGLGLSLLDPALVLERGYALLADAHGDPITSAAQARVGQVAHATLFDGTVDLSVTAVRLN